MVVGNVQPFSSGDGYNCGLWCIKCKATGTLSVNLRHAEEALAKKELLKYSGIVIPGKRLRGK